MVIHWEWAYLDNAGNLPLCQYSERDMRETIDYIFTQPRFCLDNEGKHTKKIIVWFTSNDNNKVWLSFCLLKSPSPDHMQALFFLKLWILSNSRLYWSFNRLLELYCFYVELVSCGANFNRFRQRVCQFWLKLIIKFAIVSNPITRPIVDFLSWNFQKSTLKGEKFLRFARDCLER